MMKIRIQNGATAGIGDTVINFGCEMRIDDIREVDGEIFFVARGVEQSKRAKPALLRPSLCK